MRSAVKPHRFSVWVGVLAGLGWTAARVAVPTMVGIAVDRTIVRHHDNGALLRWVIAILVVGAVRRCTASASAAFRLAIRAETDIRMRLSRISSACAAFHGESQTGQLMSRPTATFNGSTASCCSCR
jgi:ABC-type multidrug transport system fused ATPase/permease subunit